MSVLFADLVGFTSRSEDADVEDVASFVEPLLDTFRDSIERHGGSVAKFLGDAVMAIFGAPQAHDDDPMRAVSAGLSIQRALAQTRAAVGSESRARIGVATGRALATWSPGSIDAIGDVVNTAARLQVGAPVDGVLVDRATYTATVSSIRYAPMEPLRAKGKAQPVPVWTALGRTRQPPESEPRLAGRAAELRRLASEVESAFLAGQVRVVTLIGEPGIGKSRLVRALRGTVQTGARDIQWRVGRSLAYGDGAPYWALGEVVKGICGILESDDAEVADAKLVDTVEQFPLAPHEKLPVSIMLRPLIGVAGADDPQGGESTIWVWWRRFLEAFAERGPTVIVFEDIQWADAGTIRFLESLSNTTADVPLAIISTARPEHLERHPDWMADASAASTLRLSALGDKHIAEIVNTHWPAYPPLASDLAEEVVRRSAGNPLFALEYARAMEADRIGFQPVPDVASVPLIPLTVQGVIAARLDTLDDAERRLIQDASVVGEVGWIGALCAIGTYTATDAGSLLDSLDRQKLLRTADFSSVDGDREYRFEHALIKDVAYEQIRRADRSTKHEAVGDWIARLGSTRADTDELLAHHYNTALLLRADEAAGDSRLQLKARRSLVAAGDQAKAVYAHETAKRHFRRALELTTEADSEYPDVLRRLADAHVNCGDEDPNMLEHAVDEQVKRGRWENAVEILIYLSRWALDIANDARRAQDYREKAATYAQHVPVSAAALRLVRADAFAMQLAGRPKEAAELVDSILADSRYEEFEREHALAVAQAAMARADIGETTAALQQLEDVGGYFASHGSIGAQWAYESAGEIALGLGDLAETARFLELAREWADRYSLTDWVELVAAADSYLLYHRGEWASAQERAKLAIASPRGIARCCAVVCAGFIALGQGMHKTAAKAAEEAIGYGAEVQNDEVRALGLLLSVRLLSDIGEAEAALRRLTDFHDRWVDIGGFGGLCVCMLGEISALDKPMADDIVALLPDTTRWKRAFGESLQDEWDSAIGACEEIGSLRMVGEMHLRAAQAHAHAGLEGDAAPHADTAAAIFESMGAPHYAHQAAHLRPGRP